MKKAWLLLFLLFVPLASASISLTSLDSSNYNLGEVLDLSGSVSYANDFNGYLKLVGDCNHVMNLETVYIDLEPNENYLFSKSYKLTRDFLGDCDFKVKVVDLNWNVVEEDSFGFAKINSDLKGDFSIGGTEYQLGETFSMKGTITNAGQKSVEGVATVFFNRGGESVFVDSVNVVDGFLSYDKVLSLIPPGAYTIDVKVYDNFGNMKEFESVSSLRLSNEIYVDFNLDGFEFLPEDEIYIEGSFRGELVPELENVEIFLNSGNETIELSESSDQGFYYNYFTVADVKSGEHVLEIEVKDSKGNKGLKETSFRIKPVPSFLNLNLDNEGYLPKDKIGFSVEVLDQASDSMDGAVDVSLYDVNNDLFGEKSLAAGSSDYFLLERFSEPGSWVFEFGSFDLEGEASFNVLEYVEVDVGLEGSEIYFENLGNVDYEKTIDVIGNNESKNFRLSLALREKYYLDLADLFDPGIYDISIPEFDVSYYGLEVVDDRGFFGGLFGGSSVTGAATSSVGDSIFGWGFIVLIVVLVIILAYFLIPWFLRRRKFKQDFHREIHKGKRRREGLLKTKDGSYSKPKVSSNMGEFRDTMLRRANEPPRGPRKFEKGAGEYVNLSKKKEKESLNSDMFSMF